jgi:L-2-hydroxyglutarate oxidase LhgO
VAALHSPSTGIVDSHGLMLALQGDLENAGGLVALNSPLAQAECTPEAILPDALRRRHELQAATVVNAAGLHAQQLAAALPACRRAASCRPVVTPRATTSRCRGARPSAA